MPQQKQKTIKTQLEGEFSKEKKKQYGKYKLKDPERLRVILESYSVPSSPVDLSKRIMSEVRKVKKQKRIEKKWASIMELMTMKDRLDQCVIFGSVIIGLVMGAWMGWTGHGGFNGEQNEMNGRRNEIVRRSTPFDVLSAEPRGSIEAAALTLLDYER